MDKINRKQRWRYFAMTAISFAGLFVLLGLIVFNLLKVSVYEQTDRDLLEQSQNTHFIQMQIDQLVNNSWIPKNGFNIDRPPNNFQQQVILWSNDGQILNKTSLGSRFYEFQNLALSTKSLDEVVETETTDSNQNEIIFHTVTVTAPSNLANVAYVQFLVNTDPIQDTVTNFKQILIICMIAFAIIALIISYFLSNVLMKPLLAAWRKQQQFVENASHELRTPLTIIQTKLEGLFLKPNRTILEESESIALSLNEIRRLNQLTNDLLLLARSDANAVVLEKKLIAVTPFLESVIQPYREVAENSNKRFDLALLGNGEVLVDPKYIHQLLVILLDNALKYTTEGDQIQITSTLTQNEWLIAVSDTGRGIDPEHRKEIFERFYREEQSRNRETGGYGLGLSIASWVVKSHKGSLQVTDNRPRGTIFTIRLPKQ